MTDSRWLFIAHLGVGLLPGPKGTWGAALGVALFALAEAARPGLGGWVILAVATAFGVPAADRAETRYGPDSGRIVVDEVAGQALTLLFAPVNWFTLALGFILFRFFDIIKCPPMSWAERIPGGAGVVADDLLAGLYAGCYLWLAWNLLSLRPPAWLPAG